MTIPARPSVLPAAARATLDAYVERRVAEAPVLTEAQRDRLRPLLRRR